MISKNVKLVLFSSLLLVSTGCNKMIDDQHWESQISQSQVASMTEIFYQEESDSLTDVIASKNKNLISTFNRKKANQITSFIFKKYKIDIRNKFKDNPEGIIILGMFFAAKEYEYENLSTKRISTSSKSSMKYDERMNCFITAVSDVIGISQARSIWASIAAGAAEETVIAAVSLIGRRVVGILSVTLMVYSTGECLGWW